MEYKSIEVIGQGGFGIVEKVSDKKGKLYAKKTFNISQAHQFDAPAREHVKKRFIREARTQKGIIHKNIVSVIYEDLNADPPFYIMPLAICTLADDIRSDKVLGGKFMNAIVDIMAGLEELHRLGITHRDLKPGNVLRFNDGKEDYYAISDFGLMSLKQTTNVTTLTQTGMKMLSDMYTAPEIVVELKYASDQSDIYSVGCIIHDFVGTEPRIPCNEIRESDNAFSGILLRCTRKEKKRRFKSVGALRDALLSLGEITIAPRTEKGAAIFELFGKEVSKVSGTEWESVIDFIEDQYPDQDSKSVLRKLDIEHIETILLNHQSFAGRLGLAYAKWIREGAFTFGECDGLSIRLEKFILGCGIDVKAECLMAMLYMGTSHNRWYVEKKFVNHAGKEMDKNLAERLALEIRVDEQEACSAYQHLKISIRFDLNSLHPVIFETLSEVCKK